MTTTTQRVLALLKSIETGEAEAVSVINPSHYTQHNLSAADGLAGFGALLQALPQGSARVNTLRVFRDSDFVFAHTEYNFFGPKIGFDILRFESGHLRLTTHAAEVDACPRYPRRGRPSGTTQRMCPHAVWVSRPTAEHASTAE